MMPHLRSLTAFVAVGLAPLGCAASPQVDPYSMTSPEHARAAQSHAAEERAERSKFDPDAARLFPCVLFGIHVVLGSGNRTCWKAMENPTREHLAASERHREHAEAHREASALLRERARQACVAVPAGTPDQAGLVVAVDGSAPIGDDGSGGPVPAGVTLAVRTIPGVTSARLQASLDCELARRAAFGTADDPQAMSVPRAPIEARVIATARGFAVELRSSDAATNARLVEEAPRAFAPVRAP